MQWNSAFARSAPRGLVMLWVRTEPPSWALFWFLNYSRNFSSHHHPAGQVTGITGLSQFHAGEDPRNPPWGSWQFLFFRPMCLPLSSNTSQKSQWKSRRCVQDIIQSPLLPIWIQIFLPGISYDNLVMGTQFSSWCPSMCCNILIFRHFLHVYPQSSFASF